MDKTYYTISEACEMLQIKPHIIRYWETEFVKLKTKTKKGYSRRYTQKDIDFLKLIKELIYDRKFTLEGARAEIKRLKKEITEYEQTTLPINVTIHSENDSFVLNPVKIQEIQSEIELIGENTEEKFEKKTLTWGELQSRFLTPVKKEEPKPEIQKQDLVQPDIFDLEKQEEDEKNRLTIQVLKDQLEDLKRLLQQKQETES